MRRQRELEAAAEAGPRDCRDDRLGTRLHLMDQLGQGWICPARGCAELPDVGAAGEESAGPREDDGSDRGVDLGAFESRRYAGTDGVREAVDWRVGEGDDRSSAVDPVVDLHYPGLVLSWPRSTFPRCVVGRESRKITSRG